jgi:hypothetical protein
MAQQAPQVVENTEESADHEPASVKIAPLMTCLICVFCVCLHCCGGFNCTTNLTQMAQQAPQVVHGTAAIDYREPALGKNTL